jgi:hypothetical protein
LFIITSLFRKHVRTSFLNVIKSALKIKLLVYFLCYLCYFLAFIYLFQYLKWWGINSLKDTIIWFIFSGLPIGGIVATNTLESDFWRNQILKNLKLIVFIDFIINFFNFSLIVELIIFPVITFTVLLNTFSKHHKDAEVVVKFTNVILTIIGFIILSYSFYRTITEIQSFENLGTLRNILFPLVFSIISIPFMYFFTLIVEYENLFLPLKFGRKRSRELDFLIKLKLILFCNIQVNKLQRVKKMNNYDLMSISSKEEIDIVIRNYKNALARQM